MKTTTNVSVSLRDPTDSGSTTPGLGDLVSLVERFAGNGPRCAWSWAIRAVIGGRAAFIFFKMAPELYYGALRRDWARAVCSRRL
ncbi:MAG: hypothetical protein ACYDH5_13505 [Acidimicrobiales bacterium]